MLWTHVWSRSRSSAGGSAADAGDRKSSRLGENTTGTQVLKASKCLLRTVRTADKNLTLVLDRVKARDQFGFFFIIFFRQRLHVPVVRDGAKLALASSKVKPETFGASNRPGSAFTLKQRGGNKNISQQQTSCKTQKPQFRCLTVQTPAETSADKPHQRRRHVSSAGCCSSSVVDVTTSCLSPPAGPEVQFVQKYTTN